MEIKNYINTLKKNIVLIGMPGSGKSTAGVLAAKALGMDFLDTDLEIQKKTGMRLWAYINKFGCDSFLKVEEETVISCCNKENTVIATGGSTVLSKKAMEYLKNNGTVIYLNVPLEVLGKRLLNISTRGIVMEKDESIADIFNKRRDLYEFYADIVISCDGAENIEKTVEKIVCAVS